VEDQRQQKASVTPRTQKALKPGFSPQHLISKHKKKVILKHKQQEGQPGPLGDLQAHSCRALARQAILRVRLEAAMAQTQIMKALLKRVTACTQGRG
jgi:hypothetical protein